MEKNIRDEVKETVKVFSDGENELTDEKTDEFCARMTNEYYELLKAQLFAEKICILIDVFSLKVASTIMRVMNFTIMPFEAVQFDYEVNKAMINKISSAKDELKRCYVLLNRLKTICKVLKDDLVSLGIIEEILNVVKEKQENLMKYMLCAIQNLNKQSQEYTYIPGQVVENEGPEYDEKIERLLLELKNPTN